MLSIQEIYELSAGIEYHLREIEKVVPKLTEIKQSLDEMLRSREGEWMWQIHLLKEEVEDMKTHLKRYGLQESSNYEREIKSLKEQIEHTDWPAAVEDTAVCSTEEEFAHRANGILDLVIGEDLKNRKFLDFGCGKGHVAAVAHSRGSEVVGYDIDISQCSANGPLFTDNFDKVREHGPYNVILLHDVLDHIEHIDPIAAIQQVRAVMGRNTKVYVRNHPWCSRHGGHVYEHINKAFIHMILDEVELTRLCGCQSDYNVKVKRPFETYQYWFESAGLEIKSEIPIRRDIEDFFLKPSHIHQRLSQHWEDSSEMLKDLEIEFIEYILENPELSPATVI